MTFLNVFLWSIERESMQKFPWYVFPMIFIVYDQGKSTILVEPFRDTSHSEQTVKRTF